jgi:D-lactate dehydrogenase
MGRDVESPQLASLTEQLICRVGAERVRHTPADLESYAWDNTGIRARPDVVVLADDVDHVVGILQVCRAARVPVTPRGAGTGNVGGGLAVQGGVVLSLQRMNRILQIAPMDRLVVVQPGVVNADLQQALQEHGLYWPPDPSSARACSIGGNLATCAAGAGAVGTGVARDWVLGVQAVTMDGRVFRTGTRTTKGVVGYDLTRLLVGSEGTLAVITEATLHVAPRPAARRLMRAVFASGANAVACVGTIMAGAEPPSALEFLDGATLRLLRTAGGVTDIPDTARAMVLLEVSGHPEAVEVMARDLVLRVEQHHPVEPVRIGDAADAAQVWSARFALSPALRTLAPRRINEDVVVPVSRLGELLDLLEQIAHGSGLDIISFGHAGNGNLHVNLLVDPADRQRMERVPPALDQLFSGVLALGGTLSGEHGVGIQKRDGITRELDPVSLDLQQQIKQLFDPDHLLNPGKVFPVR